MKCISLQPPWGALVCAGLKDCENRDWYSKFSGVILIHQSRRMDSDAWEYLCYEQPKAYEWLLAHRDLSRAYGILGRVTFEPMVTRLESPWFFGPYAWPCHDAVLFKRVIPYRGQLGIFDVQNELTEEG